MKLRNILAILLVACCTQLSFGQAAFLTSSFGPPWGSVDYATCMNNVFGAGGWDDLDFETADPNTLFSPAYTTIYLEGSDGAATAFAAFVSANQALMEAWVTAGGLLYINAAPNANGDVNIGFGGIIIEYDGINTFTDFGEIAPDIAGSCLITDDVDITTAFPIFGNFFGHSFVSGPGISPILLDQATGNTILGELSFGAGNVVIGGLTAPQFHDPAIEAKQLLENIITHVGCNRCGPTYTLTPSCQLGDEANFYVTIDITDAGDDPSGYTVNGGAFPDITAVGSYVVGPFPNGTATITFEGITTDCLIQGDVDFDCTCDPLAVDAGEDVSYCATQDPPVDLTATPGPPCAFVAWVTDLNDIAGTTVGTTETISVAPTITTTYYAVVDCGSGLQCVDEVVVTDDPMLCLPPPTIAISDPCACGNPNNIGADPSNAMEVVDYFAEEVTIDVPSAATNVMIVETANTGVVDASGATVSTSFINTGDTDGDGFDEWVATFYHVPDVGYTLSVDVDVDGTVTSLTESGTCTQCMLPLDDVPTVGEWGLMILGLLMLITAIIGIRQRNAIEVKA